MVSTLILVRHGKAERGGADLADIDRPLTEAGRAALAGPEGFPTTFAMLDDVTRAEAELWVSPALRAQQTAQEIARVIGERPLQEHESLWEQDEVAFLQEVAASGARTVIAVGHIPFMNDVLDWITDDASLSFSPGAVAAIHMDPGHTAADCHGTLMWFAKGPVVEP